MAELICTEHLSGPREVSEDVHLREIALAHALKHFSAGETAAGVVESAEHFYRFLVGDHAPD